MRLLCARLTPSKSFTLNNRWYDNVQPKHTLFFVPPYEDQIVRWAKFLCNSHNRAKIFVHLVKVHCSRPKERILARYYGKPLFEIMVREEDLGHIIQYGPKQISKTSERFYSPHLKGKIYVFTK